MDEQSLSMTVPLDNDGFLRRACANCEREFKWLPSDDASAESAGSPDSGEAVIYTCPYCGIQAPASEWATPAQMQLAQAIVMREVVGPQLDEFARDLERTSRRSGGLIKFTARVERDDEKPQPTLTETNDMRRVEFPCHPDEPLKILDDWRGDAFCLVCGTVRATT